MLPTFDEDIDVGRTPAVTFTDSVLAVAFPKVITFELEVLNDPATRSSVFCTATLWFITTPAALLIPRPGNTPLAAFVLICFQTPAPDTVCDEVPLKVISD